MKIGIIGFGVMGLAIGERLKSRYSITVFDKNTEKTKNLLGIAVSPDIIDLTKEASIILLAVKPQDIDEVLNDIKDYAREKLVISIVAGVSAGYIESRVGDIRLIRAMPNLPLRIGKGVTCICKGNFSGSDDLNLAKSLFDYAGTTLVIKEEMMNAATAISGCGPAYLYYFMQNKVFSNDSELTGFIEDFFIPSLKASAEILGFTPQEAQLLAEATTNGSMELLKASNLPASELKEQVTSKGGATEAALEVFNKGGSFEEAVEAAFNRAIELSRASS